MDNLLVSAQKGGVGHFAILSIVGVDQAPELDYHRAKVLQEKILADGSIPYSIARGTPATRYADWLSWHVAFEPTNRAHFVASVSERGDEVLGPEQRLAC